MQNILFQLIIVIFSTYIGLPQDTDLLPSHTTRSRLSSTNSEFSGPDGSPHYGPSDGPSDGHHNDEEDSPADIEDSEDDGRSNDNLVYSGNPSNSQFSK